MRAKSLLKKKGVQFEELVVDGDRQLRSEMEQKSGRHTVPQIWIGATHVGGCDDLFCSGTRGKAGLVTRLIGAYHASTALQNLKKYSMYG